MTDQQFDAHVDRLKVFGIVAAVGLVALLAVLALGDHPLKPVLFAVAILLVSPAFAYLVFLAIWHWKGRYRGSHSDLWGALLVLETSGVFKVAYLLLHVVPDARRTGRYQRSSGERQA